MSLSILFSFLNPQRKIGDNPLLTTCVMGYFQKIQREGLTLVGVYLVSFTTRTHYIENHLRVCYISYLGEEEALKALQEVHLKVCGSYQSGPNFHFHMKWMGYYCPTMVNDCLYYDRTCDACQFHVNFIHHPLHVLHQTITSCQFDPWGFDIV